MHVEPARKRAFALLLIPLAALCVAMAPLVHPYPIGQDLGFHIQSWFEAARQIRSGVFYPAYAYSAAYNAGEPRFVFYPPISWMLGALVYQLFQWTHFVTVFVFVALASAGWAMFSLARRFVPLNAAILSSVIYIVCPYTILNEVYRAAFAELLCGAWMPLVFLAMLRARVRAVEIAMVFTLLWLTNVPCAVAGSYLIGFLAVLRYLVLVRDRRARTLRQPDVSGPRQLVSAVLGGFALGGGMCFFFLLPALLGRHNVQVSQAFFVDRDHLLFSLPRRHDMYVRLIADLMFATIALALWWAMRRGRTTGRADADIARATSMVSAGFTLKCLAAVAVCEAFAFTPLSDPFWHLPGLSYVNLTWRILTVLAVVLALSAGFALKHVAPRTVVLGSLVAMLFGAGLAIRFEGGLVIRDWDLQQRDNLRSGHGTGQTVEDVPTGVIPEAIHTNSPASWVSKDPDAYAPGTAPSPWPARVNPIVVRGATAMLASAPAPHKLTVHMTEPAFLILNLRDYPNWHVMRNGREVGKEVHRPDGLVAVPLPAGDSTVEVIWKRPGHQFVADGISVVAWLMFGYLIVRQRRGVPGVVDAVAA